MKKVEYERRWEMRHKEDRRRGEVREGRKLWKKDVCGRRKDGHKMMKKGEELK